jgi:nucleotide-binding universal stress UspA family protein
MRSPVASGSVVVGVDGSAASDEAVRWAASYASVHRRPLTIVDGVVPESPSADFPVDKGEVVQSSAVATLVDASEHASTVVVGARGRSAPARRLLGSVSRSVAEHARCTVAVVRSPQT